MAYSGLCLCVLMVAHFFQQVELNNYPAGEKSVLLLTYCNITLNDYQIILYSNEKGMCFYLLADIFTKCKVTVLCGYRMMLARKLCAFSLVPPFP